MGNSPQSVPWKWRCAGGRLSASAHDRIPKVLGIGGLDSSESIEPKHLGEAIQHRTLVRSYWA
ncbi:MAG: hypothetical protein DMG34_11505 [Acidobacteria bacterium]|nr:MAG: hypothetical protein DMG34_11505 [Acidobacteriota bacterium]